MNITRFKRISAAALLLLVLGVGLWATAAVAHPSGSGGGAGPSTAGGHAAHGQGQAQGQGQGQGQAQGAAQNAKGKGGNGAKHGSARGHGAGFAHARGHRSGSGSSTGGHVKGGGGQSGKHGHSAKKGPKKSANKASSPASHGNGNGNGNGHGTAGASSASAFSCKHSCHATQRPVTTSVVIPAATSTPSAAVAVTPTPTPRSLLPGISSPPPVLGATGTANLLAGAGPAGVRRPSGPVPGTGGRFLPSPGATAGASSGASPATSRASAPATNAAAAHAQPLRVRARVKEGGSGGVIQVIERVVPAAVWIALAGALALAAVAGASALWTGTRARKQAGRFAEMTAAALTDPLTGLLNRRGFTEAAERELERARRYGRPLAVAFVDVRGLKAVNDSEGHLAGDSLLRATAGLLKDSARVSDVVGRLGGDEMGLLLVEQNQGGAAAVRKRIETEVLRRRPAIGLHSNWDLTVGMATFPEDADTVDGLLRAADLRLYEQRGIELR